MFTKQHSKDKDKAVERSPNASSSSSSSSTSPQLAVGSPFNVRHRVHVDPASFTWSGQHGGDPSKVFQLVELLGEGAFGSVHKAVHLDSGFQLAIKVIPIGEEMSPEARDEIRREIDILKSCRSPYIVSYFGCAVHKHDEDGILDLWILMDYMCKVRKQTH